MASRLYGLPNLTASAASIELFRKVPEFVDLWMIIGVAIIVMCIIAAVIVTLIIKPQKITVHYTVKIVKR